MAVKKVMLIVAVLSGSAAYAYAGEAPSDPSDYRAPASSYQSSGVKLQMRDTDPFSMRLPGATYRSSNLKLQMRDTDPFQLRTPGVTGGGTTHVSGRSDQSQQSLQSN